MATIKYKDTNGSWVSINAEDIGAASNNLVFSATGDPNDKAPLDTKLYIDDNDFSGNDTTTIVRSEVEFSDVIQISQGGTGETTLAKAKEKFALTPYEIGNIIYPIGSIYISTNNVHPSNIFGGEWKRIQDTFLLAAGVNYEAGATGGEENHQLTEAETPVASHTHNFTQPTITISPASHYHTLNNASIIQAGPGGSGHYIGSSGSWQVVRNDNATYGKKTTTSTTISASAKNGAVQERVTTNTITPHNNMPPYLAVYIWERLELAQ